MTEKRTPNQGHPNRPPEAWRVERMVQPVPGHLGEDSRFSPWLMVGAVAAVVVIGAILLFFVQFPSSTPPVTSGTQVTPTRRVTIIRITATPPPSATLTVAPTVAIVKYTVKKNDTLSTIARQFKVSVEAIRAANNLTDDTLHVGDVLTIPLSPGTPPALAQATGTGGTSGTPDPPTNTPRVFQTPTLIAFAATSTPAVLTTPTATPGVFNYVVRANDTLSTIAGVYSTTVQSIMDLNKLSGPNIKVGQVLTIPVGILPRPTVTPTLFNSPTPSATPQYSYSAPDLLFPSDNADFAHDASVDLQWLSLGIKSDEYYVLHLRYAVNGVEQNLPGYIVRPDEGTSLTLDTSPAGDSGPAQFWWYVVVVHPGGCGAASPALAQPCAVSPVSETRTFTWR